MLRRNPTAITPTTEDIAVFEEAHARRLALAHYRRTGEDPNGYFTRAQREQGQGPGQDQDDREMSEDQGLREMDPNDELKPLPGDKARIVRGREERIVGRVGGGTTAGGGGSGAR